RQEHHQAHDVLDERELPRLTDPWTPTKPAAQSRTVSHDAPLPRSLYMPQLGGWKTARTYAGAAGVPPDGGLTSHGGGRYNGARRLRAFFVSSGGERSVKLGHPVRLLGVLLISVAAFLIAFEPVAFPGGPTTPRFQTPRLHLNLGLDLRGGSHIVLQAKTTAKIPKKVILTGADLIDARTQFDQFGRPNVAFTFRSSAAKKFE